MGFISGNFYCNTAQRQNNALQIYGWTSRNWQVLSPDALYGMLGNMEQESTINPGLWQSKRPFWKGWGLVQWTPYTKYTNWAKANGYPSDDGFYQMLWLRDVMEPSGEWIPTSAYPVSVSEWATAERGYEWATKCFLYNFERAGDSQLQKRLTYAAGWKAYFEGGAPEPPDVPDPPDPGELPFPNPRPEDFRHKMPLYMYRGVSD